MSEKVEIFDSSGIVKCICKRKHFDWKIKIIFHIPKIKKKNLRTNKIKDCNLSQNQNNDTLLLSQEILREKKVDTKVCLENKLFSFVGQFKFLSVPRKQTFSLQRYFVLLSKD